jgi:hypothetical protein
MSENQDERQQLFDYAALGREVDAFWSTAVGQYLLRRTEMEYVEALAALAECDPSDQTKIRALQSDAKRAKSLKAWLSEAIKTGLMAEANLEERTDDADS